MCRKRGDAIDGSLRSHRLSPLGPRWAGSSRYRLGYNPVSCRMRRWKSMYETAKMVQFSAIMMRPRSRVRISLLTSRWPSAGLLRAHSPRCSEWPRDQAPLPDRKPRRSETRAATHAPVHQPSLASREKTLVHPAGLPVGESQHLRSHPYGDLALLHPGEHASSLELLLAKRRPAVPVEGVLGETQQYPIGMFEVPR